jgi:ABC-type antimicrobial peptide transport system permease subunit
MQRENPHRPIVGVVGDVAEGSVRTTVGPMVYYSHRQMPEEVMTLMIRTAQPAAVSTRAIALLRERDPNLAVSNVRTIEDALAESLARERLNALVSTSFAGTGLLLACLGLYGLLAFLVAERTKEFGIRITLGARSPGLTGSVIRRGLGLVAAGAVVGIAASLWLSHAIRPVLFGIEPFDAPTYAVAIGLLFAVAVTACVIPARRAARVEPLIALRQE